MRDRKTIEQNSKLFREVTDNILASILSCLWKCDMDQIERLKRVHYWASMQAFEIFRAI